MDIIPEFWTNELAPFHEVRKSSCLTLIVSQNNLLFTYLALRRIGSKVAIQRKERFNLENKAVQPDARKKDGNNRTTAVSREGTRVEPTISVTRKFNFNTSS